MVEWGIWGGVGFRRAQLEELNLHLFIFKVPPSCPPTAPSTSYFPSLLNSLPPSPSSYFLCFYRPLQATGVHSAKQSDCCYMMDPELGRCRRTDGKKWRCRREVIQNEKYCDRHMHRGRARSRKLVEASEMMTTKSKPDIGNLINKRKEGNSETKPSAIRPAPSTSNNNYVRNKLHVEEEHQIVDSKVDVNVARNQKKENAAFKFVIRPRASANSTAKSDIDCINMSFGNVGGSHHCIDVQKDGCRNAKDNNKNIVAVSASSGLDFSPKSVLHGDSSHPNLKQASSIEPEPEPEPEPGRCRRTDGKKWRCSKRVLHEQKYCEIHIHRGSKRRVLVLPS
ncbi:hypothetical protein Dimus_006419 [Dionaea muscipula]